MLLGSRVCTGERVPGFLGSLSGNLGNEGKKEVEVNIRIVIPCRTGSTLSYVRASGGNLGKPEC